MVTRRGAEKFSAKSNLARCGAVSMWETATRTPFAGLELGLYIHIFSLTSPLKRSSHLLPYISIHDPTYIHIRREGEGGLGGGK